MDQTYQISVIITLMAAGVMAALALYAWRQRDAHGARPFAWLMTLIGGSSLASTLTLMATQRDAVQFWLACDFTCTTIAQVVWLRFIADFTGHTRWLSARRLALLAIVPAVIVIGVWTNPLHHLFYRDLIFETQGDWLILRGAETGALYLVDVVCIYGAMLLGVALAALKAFHSGAIYRRQAIAVMIGPLAMIVTSLPQLFLWSTLPTSSIGYMVFGAVTAWAIFRYRFLNLAPIARSLLIDSMSDGMLVLDPHDRIVDLNPAMQTIIGVTADQAQGRAAVEVLKAWPELVEQYRTVLEARAEIDVDHAHYDLRISPLTDQWGTPLGRLIVVRDITDRQHTEEALRAANAELRIRNADLDAYSHTVAHDLTNPLHCVIGYADALELHYADLSQDEQLDLARTIARSARKMNGIIAELLLLAEVHKTEVEMQPLDMAEIVREGISRVSDLIDSQHVQLIIPAAHTWPVAYGHAPWVEEVWVNYLSNAIKYGGQPPHVELGAEPVGSQIRFWVRDNGFGIAPDEQARLFTPFTRLDRVRARGYGLGLSIVRRIVEKLGGQVSVESDGAAGHGSLFAFTLPAAGAISPVTEQPVG
jgi:PAS domain S-box-containing protein